MAATSNPAHSRTGGRSDVRVAVIGDPGTGKSSLILSADIESFPRNVPPVLLPTRLPADRYPDGAPLTIIDTSSSPDKKQEMISTCRAADAIVLTYACDRPTTIDRLSTCWLPELRKLDIKVPVIVVGCRLDLGDELGVSLEQTMLPIMQQFQEIETCIRCSSLQQIQVPEVFYYALKAVLHPTSPLFDQESKSLKPRCVSALERIFILCDHDRDGALSDAELNDFQIRCFDSPLLPTEIAGVKKVLQENIPQGVNEHGVTLIGFLLLHALFVEKGRPETTWRVLRKFGYDNDLNLREDLLPSTLKRAHDQDKEDTRNADCGTKSENYGTSSDNNDKTSNLLKEKSRFKSFTYSEIQDATNGLSEALKIGQGAYGSVYKGYLDNAEVAIKILDAKSTQGPDEFIKELQALGDICHPHFVRLVGACFKHYSLVYEFLPNGSLEDCLKKCPEVLTWQIRVRIIFELCSVLIFLHSRKPQPMVHKDVKPQNILLDVNYSAKLADFGLCRYLPEGSTSATVAVHVTKNIQGTEWFMDPDYLEFGRLSPGCDVYAFGVTILRILTRAPAVDILRKVERACHRKTLMTIVDRTAGNWPDEVAEYLARIGLDCCEPERKCSTLMEEISSGLKDILVKNCI